MRKIGLLKVVSLLFILWAAFNLLAFWGVKSCAGLASSALLGSAAAGVMLVSVLGISSLVCYLFMLVAGVAGFNARSKGLCTFCAVVILISAIITFLYGVQDGASIVRALISVALPVLYFIGVVRAF